jgi:predicted dienelactone hydrolase
MMTAMIAATAATPLVAQNRIDGQSPKAPELAAYGPLAVGVRRIEMVNRDQIDIAALNPRAPKPDVLPRYDRPLTVEMWYPADKDARGDTSFKTFLRDGTTEVTLTGRAIRDAAPVASAANPFPLVLLSHGYPGNRFLMSHLAENLASKGYVVASIDHKDSTYNDVFNGVAPFGSTLVNRPLDQVFVLDQMAAMNTDAASGMAGLIDASNTGLIGYSMGGYGAVVNAGGGLTETRATIGSPFGTLGIHQEGSATHDALPDPRIKTAVAIGPCCRGFWDAEGLAGIDIPMLFIAGSNDTISGYETGVRALWEGAVNVDRALLTYDGGSHNTAAPIPPPEESFFFSDRLGFNVSEHYSDPVWEAVFNNNIAQHFVTSWLDLELKGDRSKSAYLDLVDIASNGVWSMNDDGTFRDDHTY